MAGLTTSRASVELGTQSSAENTQWYKGLALTQDVVDESDQRVPAGSGGAHVLLLLHVLHDAHHTEPLSNNTTKMLPLTINKRSRRL